MKIIPTSKDSIKPHVPQNPTANPLFSHAINESMKNNLQSSIFLLFLQHRSISWNDITWSLLQSKRTSRGKLAVDFLENSVLLLLHSLKSEQNFGQLFTSRRNPFFSFFCYNITLADYIASEQTVKRETNMPRLSSTPSLFISFLSTSLLSNFFDCNIFCLFYYKENYLFYYLVGKYFIMTEYNAYMPTWSLT